MALIRCLPAQVACFFVAVGLLSFDRIIVLALRPNSLLATPNSGYFVGASVENLWLTLAYGFVATVISASLVLRTRKSGRFFVRSLAATFSVAICVFAFAITIAFMRP